MDSSEGFCFKEEGTAVPSFDSLFTNQLVSEDHIAIKVFNFSRLANPKVFHCVARKLHVIAGEEKRLRVIGFVLKLQVGGGFDLHDFPPLNRIPQRAIIPKACQ